MDLMDVNFYTTAGAMTDLRGHAALVDRLAAVDDTDLPALRAAWAGAPEVWLPADLSTVKSVREPPPSNGS